MRRLAVSVGDVFERLTVVGEDRSSGTLRWVCQCSCGEKRTLLANAFVGGSSRSCGCLKRELSAERGRTRRDHPYFKHGMSSGPGRRGEYVSWMAMNHRCKPGSHAKYHHDRGIRVCERWSEFVNFFADMGPRPTPSHSIDRIDNDGNYEPGNCRWATKSQQMNNKRQRTVDLVGHRFGRLIVVERAPNAGRRVAWSCACDCGKSHVATSTNMRSGATKSCGCLKQEVLRRPKNRRQKMTCPKTTGLKEML